MHYLIFPNFNPIIINIGFIKIYWYGLMYLFNFFIIKKLFINRIKLMKYSWNISDIDKLIYFCFLGIIIGGRIGYILVYNFYCFIENPISLFKVWNGGMSFHGGFIGAVFTIYIFVNKYKKYYFLEITDLLSPIIPICIGIGRLFNFINGELWGRVAIGVPWAMIFPKSYYDDYLFLKYHPNYFSLFKQYGNLPRHPSQIYEFFLEGVLLYVILNVLKYRKHSLGNLSGLFLLFYGIMRFLVEFFRQPDIQLGLIANCISMGQMLSIPMIFLGLLMLIINFIKKY